MSYFNPLAAEDADDELTSASGASRATTTTTTLNGKDDQPGTSKKPMARMAANTGSLNNNLNSALDELDESSEDKPLLLNNSQHAVSSSMSVPDFESIRKNGGRRAAKSSSSPRSISSPHISSSALSNPKNT
jgi:hypothetical protein